jgi:hypothetical protein
MSRLYPGPGAVVLASAPCKEDEKNSKKYALLFSFFSHLFISTRASKSTAGLRRSRRWHRSHMVRQSLPRVLDDQLVPSVNTVRKHVFNICSKLNVQGRTQAIAKVRTLNILEY